MSSLLRRTFSACLVIKSSKCLKECCVKFHGLLFLTSLFQRGPSTAGTLSCPWSYRLQSPTLQVGYKLTVLTFDEISNVWFMTKSWSFEVLTKWFAGLQPHLCPPCPLLHLMSLRILAHPNLAYPAPYA